MMAKRNTGQALFQGLILSIILISFSPAAHAGAFTDFFPSGFFSSGFFGKYLGMEKPAAAPPQTPAAVPPVPEATRPPAEILASGASVPPPHAASAINPHARRRPLTDSDTTAIAESRQAARSVFATSFADPAEITKGWDLLSDDRPTLKSCRRPQNVSAGEDGLKLFVSAAKDCQSPWATGTLTSRAGYGYGYYEARLKIGDISGMYNAFSLDTEDKYEINVEMKTPDHLRFDIFRWLNTPGSVFLPLAVEVQTKAQLAEGLHDFGLLLSYEGIVLAIDGEPIAAFELDDPIKGAAHFRFTTALSPSFGPILKDPVGHSMTIRSVKVVPAKP